MVGARIEALHTLSLLGTFNYFPFWPVGMRATED